MKKAAAFSLLFLLLMGLVSVFLPRPGLAQEEKIGLTLRLASGGHQVTAGQDNLFFVELGNTGNKTITNITLSSLVKPEGWVITFKPDRIDRLTPGNVQTVDVSIKPPVKTAEKRYTVTIVAETIETRKVLDIWVGVKAPPGTWLWIGGIVLLVVIAGFIIVFLRFGRAK